MLPSLLSDTQYKVTVTPVYADGQDGISASALSATCKTHCIQYSKKKKKCSQIIYRCDTLSVLSHKDAAPILDYRGIKGKLITQNEDKLD